MEAIPTIVCDTLYSMGLHDQVPSWKIMDTRGRITVVLHWEKDPALMGSSAGSGLAALTYTGVQGGHSASASHPHSAMPSRQSSLVRTKTNEKMNFNTSTLPLFQASAGHPVSGGRLLGVHARSISQRSGSSVSSTPCLSRDNSRASAGATAAASASATAAIQHHSMLVQTSFDSNIPGGK